MCMLFEYILQFCPVAANTEGVQNDIPVAILPVCRSMRGPFERLNTLKTLFVPTGHGQVLGMATANRLSNCLGLCNEASSVQFWVRARKAFRGFLTHGGIVMAQVTVT